MSFQPLAGVRLGHATDQEHHTGCTVLLCPPGTFGGVDVRGPAPGTRELALLEPHKSVTTINAVLLTGGSALGLAAADGVVRYLSERGIGHPTPIRPIPIVPAAVIYDLFFSRGEVVPTAEMGYAACAAAGLDGIAQGNVGAGAGATVGKWGGFEGVMKGGFGLASWQEGELIVGAAAVVNSIGDIVGADGSVLAGARSNGGWRAAADPLRRFPELPPANLGTNTTLVVVTTNAWLDKVGAKRLAERAHDGLAIAVRPVHTTHDGDVCFALATCGVEAPFDLVANAAVEVVAEAIRNAVRHAATVGQVAGLAG
jgi:L-aminopeptidase/D-esterase-like protein